MFLFRFRGETRNKSRPERDPGYLPAKPFKEFAVLFPRSPSPHEFENAVFAVLQGNIKVLQNFGIITDFRYQSPVYLFRITV